MMPRRRLIPLLLTITLVAGLGWAGIHYLESDTPTGYLTLYGNVDIREAQPAFNDTGVITQMQVSEGSLVKKGDLIATLDDTRYAARLKQAQQQADNLQAVLDRLVHGSRPEEIAQARATMKSLRALYENNRILYKRTLALLPNGAASTEDRDNAQTQLKTSRENYEAARQTYLLTVRGPRAEDIQAARAAHEAAVAAVTEAEREFADTRLYAPEEGVVEDRILEPGDMASPGTPVYTIALTQPLWVRAYVPETHVGKLAPGMLATVTTDSFPGRHYRAWVGYVSPTAEFTPQTVETTDLRTRLVYQVRIYVCNARNELRLGMPATITVNPSTSTGKAMPPDCSGARNALLHP